MSLTLLSCPRTAGDLATEAKAKAMVPAPCPYASRLAAASGNPARPAGTSPLR